MLMPLRFLALLAAAALLLAGPADAEPGVTPTEILVGMWAPLTGPQALIGTSERDAIEIGMDEINKAGGIDGRKLRLVAYDDAGTPQEGQAAVRRLIDQDQVFALIAGSNSGATLPAMPLINRARVPFIVSIAAHRHLFIPFAPTSFRVYANEIAQADHVVDYAMATDHLKKPAMIHTSGDYGLGGLEAVGDDFKRRGIALTVESYNEGTQDFSAQLLRIREAGADGLFVWGIAQEAGIIVRQAKELGMNIPMFGGGATTTVLFPKAAGPAAEGFAGPWVFPSTENSLADPAVAAYRALLKQKFPDGFPPARPSLYDLAGYGALKILAEGIRRVDGDLTRAKLVKALETFKAYDTGVLFPVSFSATDHEGSSEVSVVVVDKNLTWQMLKK